ncbi:LamG-like jellyroll fold domain-containing protein [Mucilaginibacter sp.]
MKTQLLKLLFISGFLFLGLGKANAALTLGTASTTGLASGTLTNNQTGLGILGFSVKSTGGNTGINSFNFSSTTTSPAGANIGTYFTNFQVYVSTTNSFASATAITGGGIVFTTTAATTITVTNVGQTIPNNSTYYFFIVADFYDNSPASSNTFSLTLKQVNGANVTNETGPVLTLSSPPVISYTSPATYLINTAISTLSPTNTGTAVGTTVGYGAITNFVAVTASPYGVATDGDGDVYTASSTGKSIYAYTSAAAGGSIATTTGTSAPQEVAVDGEGFVWVSDNTANKVYKYSISGGLIASYTLTAPLGIAFDYNNNAYVVSNNKVWKIPAGSATGYTAVAITTTGVSITGAYGIAIDPSGNIFVSISTSTTLLKITNGVSGGTVASTVATSLKNPRNLFADAYGDIYIADYGNSVIQEYQPSGSIAVVLSGLSGPSGVSIDPNNIMYVANTGTNYIVKAVLTGGYTINSNLPTGLSFNPVNGQVTGTPTVFFGPTTYTVTASNSIGTSAPATFTIACSQNVNNAAYGFSQAITLNNGNFMQVSTTLNNFPYLLYIQEKALKTDSVCTDNIKYPNGPAGTGYDFAFTLNGSTTELFYQVESYNPATGTLLAWVNLPTLQAGAVAVNFYFGSNTPNHPTTFTQGTWASDYQEVYHFDEAAGNGGTIIDATINGNNATQRDCTSSTGQIGGAYIFSAAGGKTDAQMTTQAINTNLAGSFTLSAWVEPTSYPTSNPGSGSYDYKIVTNESQYTGGGYKSGLYGNTATTVYPEVETRANSGAVTLDRSSSTSQTAVKSTNAWRYVQGVYDNSTGTFYSYLDGSLNNSSAGAPSGINGENLSIGSDFTAGNYLYGLMDEVRISSNAKSADWIQAEFLNQKAPTKCTVVSTTIGEVSPANVYAIGGSVTYAWIGNSTGTSDPTSANNWYFEGCVGDTVATKYITGSLNKTPPYDGTASIYVSGGTYPLILPNFNTSFSVNSLTLAPNASMYLYGNALYVLCHIYAGNGTGGILSSATGSGGAITAATTGGVGFAGSHYPTQYFYGVAGSQMNLANFVAGNTGGNTELVGGQTNIYSGINLSSNNLTVDAAATLTLKSNVSGTANFYSIPSGSQVNGIVNVERYIDGGTGYRGYRFLSSPVNISGVVNQTSTQANIDLHYLTANMITGGPTGTAGGFTLTTTNPLMYLFDETRPVNHIQYTGGENVGINSIYGNTPTYSVVTLQPNVARTQNSPILVPVGNAYLVYYVGNTAAGDALTTVTPHGSTVVASGTLNQGTIPVYVTNGVTSSQTMSYTPIATTGATVPGLHQIGNPYASTIDLNAFYADNSTSVTSVFDELQAPNGAYQSYNASSGATSAATAGRYIASGQGFFVHASAAGQSISFKETEKAVVQLTSSTSPPLLLNQKSKTPVITASAMLPTGLSGLHLQLNQDSLIYTQTGIYFSPTWSDKYVQSEDGLDLDGTSVYLSSYSSDHQRLSINQLGDYSKGKVVKLYVSAASYGNYSLSLADIKNIDTLYNVYLRDHYLKDSVNLLQTKSYPLSVTTDTASYGANRFDLVIELKQLPPYQLLTFGGQKITKGVQLNWMANNTGNYTGFSLQKEAANSTFNTIYSTQSTNVSNYSYIDTNPVVGNNIYRLAQTDALGNVTYSQIVTIGYSNVSSGGLFSIYPNPASDIINILVNSTPQTPSTYTANIYNSAGMLMIERTLNTFNWTQDVSNYKEGVYVIVLKDVNDNVLAKSKFIKN